MKQEPAKQKIATDEVDKLALKVAVMDNVLTQAAVDYLERHSDGELRKILDGLDIYKSKLKTWTDLQEYISSRSGGKITPEALNDFASSLISGDIATADPSTSILKDKILAYSEYSDDKEIIHEAVAVVDLKKILSKGPWLSAFANEALSRGLSRNKLAEMLAAISTLPGTDAEQFMADLISLAGEPLLSSLRSLDLKNENIKTPEDLILFLTANEDKAKYPIDAIYDAIAGVIIKNNIPEDTIAENAGSGGKGFPWWLLVVAGGTMILFFLFAGRKKKDKK